MLLDDDGNIYDGDPALFENEFYYGLRLANFLIGNFVNHDDEPNAVLHYQRKNLVNSTMTTSDNYAKLPGFPKIHFWITITKNIKIGGQVLINYGYNAADKAKYGIINLRENMAAAPPALIPPAAIPSLPVKAIPPIMNEKQQVIDLTASSPEIKDSLATKSTSRKRSASTMATASENSSSNIPTRNSSSSSRITRSLSRQSSSPILKPSGDNSSSESDESQISPRSKLRKRRSEKMEKIDNSVLETTPVQMISEETESQQRNIKEDLDIFESQREVTIQEGKEETEQYETTEEEHQPHLRTENINDNDDNDVDSDHSNENYYYTLDAASDYSYEYDEETEDKDIEDT